MNDLPRLGGYRMKGTCFWVKSGYWQQSLFLFAVFLSLQMSGCQGNSYTNNLLDAKNRTTTTSPETTNHSFSRYHSDTLPEDCFFCGDGEKTFPFLYQGQKNLGIINLNTLELSPIIINQYDDFGKQIEEAVSNSSTHITNTKKESFFLSVFPNLNRGYASGYLSFKDSERLDTEKAANHLCSDCLNHVMENCLDTAPMGIGVIDFYTNEIRLLDKKLLGFSLGDYYISCNGWNDNSEWQEINLLVFYCPERFQDGR